MYIQAVPSGQGQASGVMVSGADSGSDGQTADGSQMAARPQDGGDVDMLACAADADEGARGHQVCQMADSVIESRG
jgi:hypothetical protein